MTFSPPGQLRSVGYPLSGPKVMFPQGYPPSAEQSSFRRSTPLNELSVLSSATGIERSSPETFGGEVEGFASSLSEGVPPWRRGGNPALLQEHSGRELRAGFPPAGASLPPSFSRPEGLQEVYFVFCSSFFYRDIMKGYGGFAVQGEFGRLRSC
jgi:hypothetical protein